MKVNREELLAVLEACRPGLSTKEVLEQSNTFILKGGEAITYNDEVSCRCPTGLPDDIQGAVQAARLLSVLSKMPEDEVKITQDESNLIVTGKRRQVGVRMDREVFLSLDQLDTPEEWSSLHEEYGEALGMVIECAGTDLKEFATACVHLHPKFMEAFDNRQMMRYRIRTGVSAPTLVKRDGLKHVVSMGAHEFSETRSWVHYKNPSGLVVSCRRFMEEFTDLSGNTAIDGEPISLPKGLGVGLDIAAEFANDNADNKAVMVDIRPGELRLRAESVAGFAREKKDIKYDGPAISFLIAPGLLKQITARHNEARISETRLKVDGKKWVYCACLAAPCTREGE